MHNVIDKFEAQLPDYDVALFYYAGHGFECNGHNTTKSLHLIFCPLTK